jgi:filamentous hemagglutinin
MVWSRDEQGNEGYKRVVKRFVDRHSETVYLTLEAESDRTKQTIITTLNHRIFAVLPPGASRAAQIAIDGRFYSGPIRNGVWLRTKDLKGPVANFLG